MITMSDKKTKPKLFKGKVVSDFMQKTVVVVISRLVKQPIYGKYMKRTKKLKAHDEKNEYKIGDNVLIQECRPLSKDKNFIVIKKL